MAFPQLDPRTIDLSAAAQNALGNLRFNTNHLQSSKFVFSMNNSPFASYFLTAITVSGVSTTPVLVPNPLSDTHRHGDKLVYEPLIITVILDEDLRVWEETLRWMEGIAYPFETAQHARQKQKGLYTDAIISSSTNKHKENFRIKFLNCHPIYLGPVQYLPGQSGETLTTDIQIQFDRLEFDRDIN